VDDGGIRQSPECARTRPSFVEELQAGGVEAEARHTPRRADECVGVSGSWTSAKVRLLQAAQVAGRELVSSNVFVRLPHRKKKRRLARRLHFHQGPPSHPRRRPGDILYRLQHL